MKCLSVRCQRAKGSFSAGKKATGLLRRLRSWDRLWSGLAMWGSICDASFRVYVCVCVFAVSRQNRLSSRDVAVT